MWLTNLQLSTSSLHTSSSGLLPSWAPVRPAAWRAAPWPAPCPWALTCLTASAASPTKSAWSASPAATCTVTPAATRLWTWPSRTLRACPTTPAPCASLSGSWEAWARPPPGTSAGPTACCRSTGVGGDELWALAWESCVFSPLMLDFWLLHLWPVCFLMHCHCLLSYVVTLDYIKWSSYFGLALSSVIRWNVRTHDSNIRMSKMPKCINGWKLACIITNVEEVFLIFRSNWFKSVMQQCNVQEKKHLFIFLIACRFSTNSCIKKLLSFILLNPLWRAGATKPELYMNWLCSRFCNFTFPVRAVLPLYISSLSTELFAHDCQIVLFWLYISCWTVGFKMLILLYNAMLLFKCSRSYCKYLFC